MFLPNDDDDLRSSQEPLLTGRRRGTMENRLWAKIIDFSFVASFLAVLRWLFPDGWIFVVSPLLWAIIEIWNEGQSPGKWLFGLQVVDSLGAPSPTFTGCIIRNGPFAFLSVCVFYF